MGRQNGIDRWLDAKILDALASGVEMTLPELTAAVPWSECPDADYAAPKVWTEFELPGTQRGCVESRLGPLKTLGRVRAGSTYDRFRTGTELPGRMVGVKVSKCPPLNVVLDAAAFAPFLGVAMGWRHLEYPVPREHVVCEPTICVPHYARTWETDFKFAHGKVVHDVELRRVSVAVHGDVHEAKSDNVVCVEVWRDHGDDGHTDFRHNGWMFVRAAVWSAALMLPRRGRSDGPFVAALRYIEELSEPRDRKWEAEYEARTLGP